MTEKEGILRMMPSGQWAVCRPEREPIEITSGELFSVEVADAGGLQLTRMEYRQGAVTTPLTAIRCAMVCAPRSVSMDKKFRCRSRLFSKRRPAHAATTLALFARSARGKQ